MAPAWQIDHLEYECSLELVTLMSKYKGLMSLEKFHPESKEYVSKKLKTLKDEYERILGMSPALTRGVDEARSILKEINGKIDSRVRL